eukprot:3393754-Rhodomonas_salina.2
MDRRGRGSERRDRKRKRVETRKRGQTFFTMGWTSVLMYLGEWYVMCTYPHPHRQHSPLTLRASK